MARRVASSREQRVVELMSVVLARLNALSFATWDAMTEDELLAL